MSKGNQDLFANIPPEIIIEILSKLPVGSIISCKCVCKSWLALLDSHDFVKFHLLKSTPVLALCRYGNHLYYKIFEFEDGVDLEHHKLHYKSVTKFNIPGCKGWIAGSANGLLFLCDTYTYGHKRHALYICNPITRDYIEIDCTQFVLWSWCDKATYGFGSSKITGQHKLVRIFQGISESVCHVYTIGTGLWRRLSHVPDHVFQNCRKGVFLNGNLHWLMSDFESPKLWISCFDLETERFSTFSSPLQETSISLGPTITILEDCLCLSDSYLAGGIVVWLMNEYGVEKSWTKQFFISWDCEVRNRYYDYDYAYPIKVFKDGDILLAWEYTFLFYSKKNNTVQKLEMFEPHTGFDVFLYTPTFLSLKNSRMEKVISF